MNNEGELNQRILSSIIKQNLSMLVDNAKEIEKNIKFKENISKIKNIDNSFLNSTKSNDNNLNDEKLEENEISQSIINNNNVQKLEEKSVYLKKIIFDLEQCYELHTPFHEEFNMKEEQINDEISKNIYNFYLSKDFDNCYNLWKKYDFQQLTNTSPERSFEMLSYLSKIRDRYKERMNLIDQINNRKANINEQKMRNNYIFDNKNEDRNESNLKLNESKYSQMTNDQLYKIKSEENEISLNNLRNKVKELKFKGNLLRK